MALILKGKPVADRLLAQVEEELSAYVDTLDKPTLAVVCVGENSANGVYLRNIQRQLEKLNMKVLLVTLKSSCTEADFMRELDRLNNNEMVHAILMMQPLPASWDYNTIRNTILPAKDVEGLSDYHIARVVMGKSSNSGEVVFAPCTAQAVIELLNFYHIELDGKAVSIIGRSMTVGKPLASLLLAQNATPTICHSHTKDLAVVTRRSDIVVACAGSVHLVTSDFIAEGTGVIDVGINMLDGKLTGDVAFEKVEPQAKFITPVPGGVGSITVAVLAANVLACYKQQLKLS